MYHYDEKYIKFIGINFKDNVDNIDSNNKRFIIYKTYFCA